jgi:phage replication-related protein YjqB (UPF0714/DUF867 family)
VTVHGYGRRDHTHSVLLGGQNRPLAEHVAAHLRNRLPDYDFVTELAQIPKDLRGLHPDNPVNLPANKGVQIELPPRARASDLVIAELVHGLVDALSIWTLESAMGPSAR